MRIAVMNRSGVVALFVVLLSAPFLLGALAEEAIASHDVDAIEDVSMIDLSVAARPRERILQSTLVWCIANTSASNTSLQNSLDWACGTGSGEGQVNCGPINSGGACYDPNTLISHCDWAFNTYFQRLNATAQACDFQGAAVETTTDPSTPTCEYIGSNLTGVNGSTSPSSSPVTAPGPNIYGSGATPALEPHFLGLSTAVVLFTYIFT